MIFLTGGTGMVGAHLLFDLTKDGFQVRALKRKQSDLTTVKKIFSWYSQDAGKLFARIEWLEGELMDKSSLYEGMKGVTAILHAAARVSFDPRDAAAMLHQNREGTANLTDVAAELKIPRFCHVSSIAALGNHGQEFPVNEDFSWRNSRRRSAYSESKFQAEMEVWRAIHEGLACVIVNPAVILGPGNWESGSPRFFQTIWKGMRFYPPGGTGFVDVRDVSAMIIRLILSDDWDAIKNQRYILSAENWSYRDLFDRIAGALGRSKPTLAASPFLLQLGWRASLLASLLTGKQPTLTRETARSAASTTLYDGSKITRTIEFAYTPIDQTIQEIGKIFLKD